MMVDTTINGRWSLRLPAHRAARTEWVSGWETERLADMHRRLEPGDVIYDVGAEEGDLPALWASWGCQVGMFEPNPAVWPNIAAIWAANRLPGPLFAYCGFAGDTPRHDDRIRDGWPTSAIGPIIGDHGFCQLNERPDLPATTIDLTALRCTPPDAITIDAEGSELRVLTGATDTLDDVRPTVWVSIHPTFMDVQYGDHPADLHRFMADRGYTAHFLGDDHEQHWRFDP